jgi:hypothetical protein
VSVSLLAEGRLQDLKAGIIGEEGDIDAASSLS